MFWPTGSKGNQTGRLIVSGPDADTGPSLVLILTGTALDGAGVSAAGLPFACAPDLTLKQTLLAADCERFRADSYR